MSTRSVTAQYIRAQTQTIRYTVELANGSTGVILASGDQDAKMEAQRLAQYRKSALVSVKRNT